MEAPVTVAPGRKNAGIAALVSAEMQLVCSVYSTVRPRPAPWRKPRVGCSTANAPNTLAISSMGITTAVARYRPVVQ
jgi:hypothetical protein